MEEVMIKINSLTKRFGEHVAVDNLSFEVRPGEVLGFLGPNGAGKSTTMKMLTGFLAPDGGSASICGFDIRTQTLQAQRQMGYLPRSEERRVGKECRSRESPYSEKKKECSS